MIVWFELKPDFWVQVWFETKTLVSNFGFTGKYGFWVETET